MISAGKKSKTGKVNGEHRVVVLFQSSVGKERTEKITFEYGLERQKKQVMR